MPDAAMQVFVWGHLTSRVSFEGEAIRTGPWTLPQSLM